MEFNYEDIELSDEDLAPKVDKWDDEAPKIPDEDLKKCQMIIDDLMKQYQNKQVSSISDMWSEIQKRATDSFIRLGIKAHVEIVVIAKRILTDETVKLRIAKDQDDKEGYRIIEGEFYVPPGYEAHMISPVIVADDWSSRGQKQDKAVQTVVEREKRRSRGEGYFPKLD